MKNKPHLHLQKQAGSNTESAFFLSIRLQVSTGTTVDEPVINRGGNYEITISHESSSDVLELKGWRILHLGVLGQDAILVQVCKKEEPIPPNKNILGEAKVRYEDAEEPDTIPPID